MIFYFQLQYNRFKRSVIESGLPLTAALLLIPMVFLGGSVYLFHKTEFASWIYLALAVGIQLNLNDGSRVDHLQWLFQKATFRWLRVIENAMVAFPFLLFLLFQRDYFTGGILILFSPIIALLRTPGILSISMPSPFKRMPFELPAGFRKYWWLLLFAFYLLIKGLQVHNYGLSLAALGLTFLMVTSFYAYPEKIYFAWIYAFKPKEFLKRKITIAMIGSSMLTLPTLLLISLGFPEQLWISMGIQVVGYTIVSTMILAKYSAFPHEISVPQALLFGLGLWFPPMLLIMLIVFYRQAVRQLNPYLP